MRLDFPGLNGDDGAIKSLAESLDRKKLRLNKYIIGGVREKYGKFVGTRLGHLLVNGAGP